MQERPLLIPLAALIAGLWSADLLGTPPPSWPLAALLLTSLAACRTRSSFPFLLSLSALFFVWGGVSLQPFLQPRDALARHASEQPAVIEGIVDERPEGNTSGGERFILLVERLHTGRDTAVSGRMLVNVKEGRTKLAAGDRVLLCSKIRRPRNLGLPGELDYERRLAYQRVFTTAFVKGPDEVILVRSGEGWRHGMDALAWSLARFIERHAPPVEAGVLKALLLGEKGDIPQELQDAYARSGVSHILSISGFHVGIIFLCVFQLLFVVGRCFEFPALRLDLRKTVMFLALPVVVFYLFLSGAAPATVRSVLMIAGLVAALTLRREVDPVNSVMLAAAVILFAAPQTVFDVSFELSFLAIWGLVVLAPPLAARFAVSPKPARWLLLLTAASAAAIVATLVPVAYYFHRISFIGLLANLVIVPLLGYGAVVAGFASLPLSLVSPVSATVLLAFAAHLVRLSDRVIVYLAQAPVLTWYAPTRLDVLLACLVLCALTFPRSKRGGLAAASLLSVILLFRAVPPALAGDGVLHLWFLSVGQGDAALVRLPDGKALLVDGGGRAGDAEEEVGRRLLLPALQRLGVRRIDYLVLSHEHPDHLQGVLYLAENFDIGEFWESGVPSRFPEYLRLKWVLSARGIPVRPLGGAPPLTAGGAVIEPLWPVRKEPPASRDANDASLVFRLRHGNSSILFMGDLGGEGEEELLAMGAPLRSSLLKVGHHGSRYGSTDAFLAAVHPQVAVVSAGFANPFRLPAPSTVNRLEKRGIRLYRTDLDGTVEAVCRPDGNVSLFLPWGHFN